MPTFDSSRIDERELHHQAERQEHRRHETKVGVGVISGSIRPGIAKPSRKLEASGSVT